MNKILAITALLIFGTFTANAADVFGTTSFFGDAAMTPWPAPENVAAETTTGGTYTSGSLDFTYKVSGSNLLGRLPMSSTVNVLFTGSATENAVSVTWEKVDGVFAMILLKSSDGGSTYEWISLDVDAESFIDDGSHTFDPSDFEANVPVIPDPIAIGFGGGGDVTLAADQTFTGNNTFDAATFDVDVTDAVNLTSGQNLIIDAGDGVSIDSGIGEMVLTAAGN